MSDAKKTHRGSRGKASVVKHTEEYRRLKIGEEFNRERSRRIAESDAMLEPSNVRRLYFQSLEQRLQKKFGEDYLIHFETECRRYDLVMGFQSSTESLSDDHHVVDMDLDPKPSVSEDYSSEAGPSSVLVEKATGPDTSSETSEMCLEESEDMVFLPTENQDQIVCVEEDVDNLSMSTIYMDAPAPVPTVPPVAVVEPLNRGFSSRTVQTDNHFLNILYRSVRTVLVHNNDGDYRAMNLSRSIYRLLISLWSTINMDRRQFWLFGIIVLMVSSLIFIAVAAIRRTDHAEIEVNEVPPLPGYFDLKEW